MDGMFNSLLSPVLNAIYPCALEEVRNHLQKEVRIIDTLEPLMNQHRLVVDYTALKHDIANALTESQNIYYSLLFQMTHINRERGSLIHDDRLDALAIGVQYWNERNILRQDSDVALTRYHRKQVEDELKRRADIFKKLNNGGRGSRSKAVSRLKAFS